ncbi:MAG TPA: large conductance mechanosensitive channel protein MscL [Candidatus Limnocylindrales bacterium]|nr:large conductance mechanosensitive channel protein MscL [Candidatus Limnocylindrales bacterium]
MVGEFRAFLLKTNALALAIGVIIGAALGAVVTSLVNDIIMPPVGVALGGIDFSQIKTVLKEASGTPGAPGYVPEAAIRWGVFINSVIAFIVIALVVFWISRMFIREPEPAEVKTCPFCREANDVAATRCKACTSEI